MPKSKDLCEFRDETAQFECQVTRSTMKGKLQSVDKARRKEVQLTQDERADASEAHGQRSDEHLDVLHGVSITEFLERKRVGAVIAEILLTRRDLELVMFALGSQRRRKRKVCVCECVGMLGVCVRVCWAFGGRVQKGIYLFRCWRRGQSVKSNTETLFLFRTKCSLQRKKKNEARLGRITVGGDPRGGGEGRRGVSRASPTAIQC